MKAIILAGGVGKRLKPLTDELPKPMIPVAGKPLIDYNIELLKKHGITDIGITLMFLPQYIKDHFKENKDINFSFFEENKPLGTAGSVKLAEDMLDERFVVLSGDSLTNVDLSKILKYHSTINADVTIVLSKQSNPLDYGVVLTDDSGRVKSFLEKPEWESVVSNTVNTGIYVINKNVLEKVPKDTFFDFSNDLFPLLLKENYNIFGYITEDYWCDLGRPEAYLTAVNDVLNGKVTNTKYENVLCENIKISEETRLIPPVFIGKNTILNGKNVIGPNVTIGENSVIEDSVIKDSVIWNKAVISGTQIEKSIIGDDFNALNAVFSGKNVLGNNVKLENNVQLKYGTKIKSNLTIPAETILSGEVTKSFSSQTELWNDGCITGVWNHSINVDVLQGIACSLEKPKLLIAHNGTALSEAICQIITSFSALCGTNVYCSCAYEASARFFSSVNKIAGIYLSENNENITLQIFDENGLNISHNDEKKIDFNKKDFTLNRGKIVRLTSLNKDFEYFLNAAFPFGKKNIEIFSDGAMKLHNVFYNKDEFNGKIKNLSEAAVIVNNGTVTDVYLKDGRVSTLGFLELKFKICKFLGGKGVYLPIYAKDDFIETVKQSGLQVFRLMQHKGDSMQQAETFNSVAVLLEYVPEFFALALAYYISANEYTDNQTELISRFDFNCQPENTCRTIFQLNKNKNGNIISANYKNGFITILPRNNGYSFTAYGRFMQEEYSTDILEQFVKDNIIK